MQPPKAAEKTRIEAPEIFRATVSHGRRTGTQTGFSYDVLFLRLEAQALFARSSSFIKAVNRFGVLSLYETDHGDRTPGTLKAWLERVKQEAKAREHICDIRLVSLPRVFGFAFKPVSFWFCLDRDANVRAVFCEVNNTFGETHTYVCEKPDGTAVTGQDVIRSKKLFHVSPFFERDGRYDFRFSYSARRVGVRIDHFAPDGELRLITAVKARLLAERGSGVKNFLSGIRTLMVFPLILRHALALWWRGIPYVPKPAPLERQHLKPYRSGK